MKISAGKINQETIILIEHYRPISDEIHEICQDMHKILITRSNHERQRFQKVISIGDKKIESILDRHDFSNVTGVYTPFDEALLDAEKISSHLNLSRNQPAAIACLRNKYLMREVLSKDADLNIDYSLIQSPEDIKCFFDKGHEKMILKPIVGQGSIATKIVAQTDDLERVFDEISEELSKVSESKLLKHAFEIFDCKDYGLGEQMLDPKKSFLAEECLTGKELSVEGIVSKGVFHLLACHQAPDKETNFDDTSFIAPANISDQDQERIRQTLEKAFRIIGVENRTICAEVFLQEDNVTIIEINSRPGGLATVRSVERLSGIHLAREAISMAIGQNPKLDMNPKTSAAGFCAVYPSNTGKLIQINNLNLLIEQDPNFFFHCYFNIGDSIQSEDMGIPYLGYIYCEGENYNEVQHKIENALQQLEFVIQ